MARNATSLAARLKLLEAALAKSAERPCGETLSFEPMRHLLGISRPILTGWCQDIPGFEESGCFDRGGNGIAWTFEPRATILFLIRHFERERDAAASKARAMKEMAGGDALAGVPNDFDLRQTREMVRTSNEVQDLRIRQGALTDAGKVSSAFREAFGAMQSAGLQAAQEMDPQGQWPPEVRSKVEDGIRSLMLKQQQAAQRCLDELRANGGAAQPG